VRATLRTTRRSRESTSTAAASTWGYEAYCEAFVGQSVKHYAAGAERFLRDRAQPTLGRSLLDCTYEPIVELLLYLDAHGFTNYIASGGDRDFMRPVTEELYAIPSERVIGSSNALQWTDDEHGGMVRRVSALRRLVPSFSVSPGGFRTTSKDD
jgi:hypothetical protein